MPYITQERRKVLNNHRDLIPANAGELNFYISDLINDYMLRQAVDNKKFGYTIVNEVMGVLECAKLELYRVVAAPYEDVKKDQNGPVYEVFTA